MDLPLWDALAWKKSAGSMRHGPAQWELQGDLVRGWGTGVAVARRFGGCF